jgi:hypothetical protein
VLINTKAKSPTFNEASVPVSRKCDKTEITKGIKRVAVQRQPPTMG